MLRTSPYYDLRYRVDCRGPNFGGWETIVAFNTDVVAKRYAAECARSNSHNTYRVMERKGRGWVEMAA